MNPERKERPKNSEFIENRAKFEENVGHIWDIAKDYQLDPYPTVFEVVPPDILHEFASYGIPGHFSHWTYGKSYWQLKTHYNYGLSRIYEMVINSNPAQAFLLDNNSNIANLMVVAHVFGHVDFFKHNYMFQSTTRDMPHVSQNRSERVHEYEKRYGQEQIERFLDSTLTLSQHIDPTLHHRPTKSDLMEAWENKFYGNDDRQRDAGVKMTIPLEPDMDVLGFIRDFAPYLKDWQRDIIDVVRDESYYFYPQMKTKIMNEGWAVIHHKMIMHEMAAKGFLSPEESEGWWALHAGVAQHNPKNLNPYWFGMVMFEWLFDYYNGNMSDKENAWLNDNGWYIHPKYQGPAHESPAIPQLRNIMKSNSDVSFIGNYFNYIPATRMEAYLYESVPAARGQKIEYITTTNWVEVRDGLLNRLNFSGRPYIYVSDGDYHGRQELLLEHSYEGLELDEAYIKKTLPHVYKLWGRPVHLNAMVKDHVMQYTFDGTKLETKKYFD